MLDGQHVRGLDQTGLAQKGGPVVSDLKISRRAARARRTRSPTAAPTSTSASTCSAPPTRTTSTVRHRAHDRRGLDDARRRPGRWSSTPQVRFPESAELAAEHRPGHAQGHNVYLDAAGARRGPLRRPHDDQHSHGRRGLPGRARCRSRPTRSSSAIALNGVAVEKNLRAFRWGRMAVVDREPSSAAELAPGTAPAVERRRALARGRARDRRSRGGARASCGACSRCACPS